MNKTEFLTLIKTHSPTQLKKYFNEKEVKLAIANQEIDLIEELITNKIWWPQYNSEYYTYSFKKSNPEFILVFQNLLKENFPKFDFSINMQILNMVLYAGSFDNLCIFRDEKSYNNPKHKEIVAQMLHDSFSIDSLKNTIEKREKFLDFVLLYQEDKLKCAYDYLKSIINQEKEDSLFIHFFDYFIRKDIITHRNVNEFKANLTHTKEHQRYVENYEAFKEKKHLELNLTHINDLTPKRLKI